MNSAAEWARLVRAAADPAPVRAAEDRKDLLAAALTAGATITADSMGCSITELVDGGFDTPLASNGLALELDRLQYAADDGPCVATCRNGQEHRVALTEAGQAYLGFVSAALSRGVQSVLSLPLTGVQRSSALNLYAASPDAFDAPHERAIAALLARCTASFLSEASIASRPGGIDNEWAAKADGALIERALGELRGLEQLTTEQAFTLMAHRSRGENRSIFDIARDITTAADESGENR